jgi:hypothetical protein
MKAALLAVLLCLAALPGCATLTDAVSRNQFVVSVAMRQAVGRFIAAGGSVEAERERALIVYERTERVARYLDGNPTTTYDALLETVNQSVNWAELDKMDRMLAEDVIALFKAELKGKALAGDVLADHELIVLRDLLGTASSAALLFLEQ